MIFNKITLAFAALCCLLCCACSPKEDEQSPVSDSITFVAFNGKASYRLLNSAQDFSTEKDIVFTGESSIMLPTEIFGHEVKPLHDQIMREAFDTVAEDPIVAMHSCFRNDALSVGYNLARIDSTSHRGAPSLEPDHLIDSEFADGQAIIVGNIYSLTTKILTYRISHYIYMPRAAHGMTTNQYITYFLPEQRALALTDIFSAESLDQLPQLIAERAKKLKDQLGPTSIETLPANGAFIIDLDGSIHFIYQPYEVASYAQGEIHVPFYPYELQDHFTPTGKAIFGF